MIIIGASEASPGLPIVFNVEILSVCLYHDVMDRHDNLLLRLMILYQLQSSFARPKHALHAPT